MGGDTYRTSALDWCKGGWLLPKADRIEGRLGEFAGYKYQDNVEVINVLRHDGGSVVVPFYCHI